MLRKPKTEFETTDTNMIELFDEEDAEAIRNHKPDAEQNSEVAEVDFPIFF